MEQKDDAHRQTLQHRGYEGQKQVAHEGIGRIRPSIHGSNHIAHLLVEVPREDVKIINVERWKEVSEPSTNEIIVYKEVPKFIDVQVDKEVQKIIVEVKTTDVSVTKETAAPSTKTKNVDKIIEKLVKVASGEPADDDQCITQAAFIQLWNKLMNIPIADNTVTEDCIDEVTFCDLVSKNMAQNYNKWKEGQ